MKKILLALGLVGLLSSVNGMAGDLIEVGEFHNGLASVKIGSKCGYIDRTGKVVINLQFSSCYVFNGGLASVQVGKKWGFMDKTGKIVIKPRYEEAYDFRDGLAAVKLKGKLQFINSKGETIFTFENADGIEHGGFRGSFAAYKVGGKIGFVLRSNELVNETVRVIIPPRFDAVQPDWFNENLVAVKLGDKWGFIDEDNQIKIEPRFELVGNFWDGLACAEVNHKYGYIDVDGEWVIQPRFDACADFHHGLASGVTSGGKRGVIDQKGEWVVKPQFERMWDFDDSGRAMVRDAQDNVAFIDTKGAVVTPIFKWDGSPSEGLTSVKKDGQVGFIDNNGKWVISPDTLNQSLAKYLK